MSSAAASCSFWCSTRATDIASSRLRGRSLLWRELADLVGLQVELEDDGGVESAVGLLRLVLEIDLGECEGHALHAPVRAGVGVGDARHDHVVHLDDEE